MCSDVTHHVAIAVIVHNMVNFHLTPFIIAFAGTRCELQTRTLLHLTSWAGRKMWGLARRDEVSLEIN